MEFKQAFGDYVCAGDSIEVEHEGITYTARIVFDEEAHIDDDDVHAAQEVTGADDETHAQIVAAREAWARNEWFYAGVVISASKAGVVLDEHAASLWTVECNYPGSDNAYLTEVANELLEDAQSVAKTVLAKLTEV